MVVLLGRKLTREPRGSDVSEPIWLYLIISDRRSCDIDVPWSLVFGSSPSLLSVNFSASPFSADSSSRSYGEDEFNYLVIPETASDPLPHLPDYRTSSAKWRE